MTKIIIIVIFITGSHNKPHGCGASVASAAGPFTTKKRVLEARMFDFLQGQNKFLFPKTSDSLEDRPTFLSEYRGLFFWGKAAGA
jgi:hypothetical protein